MTIRGYRARWLFRALGISFSLAAIQGCGTTRPDPAAEATIARVSGLSEAISFRVEGGPVDEPGVGDRLTLADAVHRAVATDPGLQAALARVRVAMAEADQARLLPNPVLNVLVRWGPGSAQIEASLTEDIIKILQTSRRVKAADNRLRQAAADAVTTALDVLAEVQSSYAAVQAGERRLASTGPQRQLIERLDEIAKARLAAGEGTRGDASIVTAQAAMLSVELADIALTVRQDRLHLARLVGEPSGSAEWTLDEWRSPAIDAGDERVWIETALRLRPEIQSSQWQLAALGADAALARSGIWDGLSLGVEAERDGDWASGPGVSVPLPIFDTGRARKDGANAAVIEARHNRTLAQRLVVEQVRVAHRTLADSQANAALVRDTLIPAELARFQQAEAAYRAGESDLAALLLAEQGLLSARSKAVEVESTAALALIRLHRAVGGPGVAAGITAESSSATAEFAPPTSTPH